MLNDTRLKISIIVPVYNGRDQLRRCLRALTASQRIPDKVIVVDDGSTDDSASVAQEFGYESLTLSDGPRGPARARNRGVSRASDSDIFVFFDSDVVVHPDTLTRIEGYFVSDPNIAALFGSYDGNPTERNTVSLYKNLFLHHVHQVSRAEASTFWAGCGAIRHGPFDAVGGFDETYTRPTIEDIELGVRLRKAGYRILLCRDIKVTHLKKWTIGKLIKIDIFHRAIPWSRLISKEGQILDELNLTVRHRIAAIAALVLVAAGIMAFWSPVSAIAVAVLALITFVALNYDLFRVFAQSNGLAFAAKAAGLHLLYYLYSTGTFVAVNIWEKLTSLSSLLTGRIRRVVRSQIEGPGI
jgi:GT2 family glycosyltransferase